MRMLKVGTIAIASLVAVGALADRLSAQGNSANPVLHAIQDLQNTVNDLVTSTAPGSVLVTPAGVVIAGDGFRCSVTNVSADSHSVTVQLINGLTGETIIEHTPNVGPGHAQSLGSLVEANTLAFCKFTVTDGTKNELRAALTLISPNEGDRALIAAE